MFNLYTYKMYKNLNFTPIIFYFFITVDILQL